MKKRILSLLLVMAMLLSVVPMIGSAEEASNQGVWYGRSLTLGSGIAINFVTAEAVEDFGKVEFEVNGQVVQRYSTAEEGQTSFAFTRLTPSKLGQDVTAKMYNTEGEVIGEITTNVLSYCEAALAGDNAALKKLCVDLLNYGAATQTYVGSTDTLVNAVLTEQQAALGTSEYFPVRLVTDQSFYDYGEQTSATWYGAGLVLNDTITMRLQYITETPDTYVTVLVGDDRVLDLESTLVDEERNLYEVYYNGLKPSEFSVARGFLICDASHAKISQRLTYSMESYAYSVKNNPTTYADEVALIDALTDYCRSVCELNGHSFTKGICDTCGVEKVFIMDSESITVQAEDAILGNIQSLQDSNDPADGKTVQLWRTYDATQAQGKTAKDYAGDIVVKFIPKYSGTYTVQTKVNKIATSSAVAQAMIVAENDITTKYSRAGFGSLTSTGFGTANLLDSPKTFTMEAGKPYAIRIAATTINILFDKFIITHEHSYDSNGVCTGCGETKTFKTQNGAVTIEAEEGIFAAAGTENVIANYTAAPASVKENTNASGGKTVKFNKTYSNSFALDDMGSTPIAHASYHVTADVSRQHYIWLKVYAEDHASYENAVYCYIDGLNAENGEATDAYYWRQPLKNGDSDYSASATDFYWVRVYQEFLNATAAQSGEDNVYYWTAGETYTLRFRGYTDKVQIDQILITTDADYNPNN